MIRISLEGLDPKPSAIYLGNKLSHYGTALGFAGHTQVMTLLDRENAPYFKFCEPCHFNKIYKQTGNTQIGCPGGYRHLKGNYPETSTRIYDTRYRVPLANQGCRRILAGDFKFESAVEVPYAVNIPDYILVSRKGYDFDSSYKLKAYLAKPEAENLDDLWKGIPFLFGNTHIEGMVCLGSSQYDVTWSNWSTIQKAYLNFSRNNDWTEYWRSSSTPELATLVDYANRLNAEGASFVNQFMYSSFKDWQKHIFWDTNFASTNKWILEFKPNYQAIMFDKNGSNKFYIQLDDNSYIDTDLNPANPEVTDEI